MGIVVVSRGVALALLVAVIVFGALTLQAALQLPAVAPGDAPPPPPFPVCRVATTEPVVVITFNAAWKPSRISLVLDLLQKHGVRATFFVTAFWVEETPDLSRDIVARGHEFGLYSATYPHMTSLSRPAILRELSNNAETIVDYTGAQARFFRPPFGEYNQRLVDAARSFGFTTVLWSIDAQQPGDDNLDEVAQRLLANVGPGDIVAFDGEIENTPALVDVVLTRLESEGYRVSSLGELLDNPNGVPEPDGCLLTR